MPPKTIIEQALIYAEQGLAVFPVNGKVPATPNGLHDATIDPGQIKRWNLLWRGLAVRTGKISNLVVLDVDNKNGIDGNASLVRLLAMVGEFTLPQTFTIGTPSGGCHYWFLAPEQPLKNKVGFAPGLDIRAEGGYVVTSPTSGYTVLHDDKVAAMPAWLFKILFVPETAAKQRSNGVAPGTREIVQGSRNNYLAQVAGRMQRSDTLTLEALSSINDRDCDPPLREAEVESIFHSVSRYTPEDPIVPEGASQQAVIRASDLMSETLEFLSDKSKLKGQPTGIAGYDKMIGGGLRLGELTILCASAKTGKSSFFHFMIHKLLSDGHPVGYASREMSPATEVIPNLLAIAHNENAWNAEMSEERKAAYTNTVSKWPLYFAEGYGYFPLDKIDLWVKELVKLGVKYFFVDHLHYCLEEPEEFKLASKLAQKLKTLTKTENIHIELIVQPTKIADGMQLGLNTLRGGAGIGQAADNLFTLERHKVDGKEVPNVSKLRLDVTRHKLARPGSIYLQYDSDTTAFIEVEPAEPAPTQPAEYENVTQFPRKY